MGTQDPIISFLLQEKMVDENTLQAALDQQRETGQSLIGILKKEHLLNEEQLTRVVAAANKIKFVNLSPEMVDPMVAHLVSYEIASQHNLIPIRKEDHRLVVAMSSPLDLAVRDQIEMKTGYKVVPVAAVPSAIRQTIHYHFNVANVTKQAIVSMRLKEEPSKTARHSTVEQKSVKATDAPIAKLVSSIIRGAIDARASDIHIEPQESDVRVRYRVDGILRDAIDVPSSAQLEVVSHIKIMSDMDISERRIPQDGHMALRHDGKEYDLRVSSLPAVGGEKIVIRILDKNASKWSFDTVVTSPEDNQKFRELLSNPYGMLLLTGPTGSGKTTTLYSVLQLVNTPERNIVTVEDPVEYRLDGITQVQVRPVAGMTFARSLRSIVRQDPDVILVGEIRDLETAEIAISAALTGHLVLSTLHTNDAAGAISRLINLGIPPFLVSSALLGTVAQRLIRTSCSACKHSYQPSEEEIRLLFGESYPDGKIELYRSGGCNSCYQFGYRGRKAIYEILAVSEAIRRMIVDGASDDAIKQQAIAEGMRTIRKSGVDEVLNGTTTLYELMRVVDMRAD
ncbi:MAG: GspE/PulE family protein [Sedimentisphaerales bacterium]